MRILHLGTGNMYGGVETLLHVLARHGNRPDLQNEFLVMFHGHLEDQLRVTDAPVHFLSGPRLSRPWQVWRFRREFRALASENKFDLAIAHSAWAQQILGPELVRAKIPLLTWIHSIDQGRPWLEARARRWTPVRLVLNSRYMDQLTADWYPNVRRERHYYPVAPPSRVPLETRRELRAELGVPPESVVIVTACRLEPWKGHAVLLQALAQLKEDPRWHALIAGGVQRPAEVQLLDELKAFAKAHGIAQRVHFLGQRQDVPVLLAAADIHCQPNQDGEPFGIVFVEALYAGLPVVSTAIGGALEIVTPATGRLVPVKDPTAVAQALRGLLDDPSLRKRLGAAGPERATEICHPNHRLPAMQTLFESAARASS